MPDINDEAGKKKASAPEQDNLALFVQQLPGSEKDRLSHGEVVVEVKEVGTEKIVSGRILLDEPVEKIWPILANPYEFKNGIYPRMHKVDILEDRKDHSRMRCSIELGKLLPDIVAVVDTDYVQGKSIDFHKVGGTLKGLTGGWTLTPQAGGKTEVTYWMNIDPGFLVPAWIIRQGIKMELPNTLKAVRHRLDELHKDGKPAPNCILAAEI